MIAFLAAISMRRLETFERAMNEIELPEFKIPEIELPDLRLDELDLESLDLEGLNLEGLGLEGFGLDKPEKPLTIEEIKQNYKTFISPDKTIQMKYPGHWRSDPIILKQFKQQAEKYKIPGSEILFLALQIRLAEMPSILIVTSIPPEKGLEQIIEKAKELAKEQQVEIEIISQEIKDNMAYFEIKQKKENLAVSLMGKIVFTEKRNYLISILIPSELKEAMLPEIDFIFNSIEII